MESINTDLIFKLPEINFSSGIIQDNKNVLFTAVIYQHENNPEYLEQMQAIYKSIGVDSKNEIQIVAVEKNNPHFRLMEVCQKGRNFFLFGMSPMELGLALPHSLYKFINIGQQQFLCSDSFSVLHHNVEAKKKLWFSLKTQYLKN